MTVRMLLSAISVASVLATIVLLQGCTTVPAEQQQPEDDPSTSREDPSCTRTAQSVPSNAFVRQTFDCQCDVVAGANTGLAAVLSAQCAEGFSSDALGALLLMEVGENGQVVAMYSLLDQGGQKTYFSTAVMPGDAGSQFEINDGCLGFTVDVPPDLPMPSDPSEYQDPLCGALAMSLWQDGSFGLMAGQGNRICVRMDVERYSRCCWQDDEGWHEETVFRVTYVALGALTVDATGGTVNISNGDSVTMETTMTSHYLLSPRPEDLGYQPFDLSF